MKNLFLHTFLAAALLTGTSLCRQAQAQTLDFGSNSGSSNPSNFEQLAKEDAGKTGAEWPAGQTSSTVSDAYGKTETTVTTGTVDSSKGMSDVSTGSSSGTSTGTGSGSSASGSGSTAAGSGFGTAAAGSSSGSASADSSKKAEDATKYTGVFNDRQIVPNSMAIYCKTNAEDMVKERKKLYDCINLIAQKINDTDTAVRDENRLRYDEIRYEELKTLMSQAVAKGASISNYEKIQNEVGNASGQTKTEHEDNVAIANTLSTLTDVINTMRDLYAERLKNEAIAGINSINPDVIAKMAKNADETDSTNGGTASGTATDTGAASGKGTQETNSTEVEVKENMPKTSEYTWVEGNNCSRRVCKGSGENDCIDEKQVCPDNTYPLSDGISVICFMGKCVQHDLASICTDETLQKINKKLVTASGGKCTFGDGKEVDCQDGIYSNGYACLNGTCKSCKDEL